MPNDPTTNETTPPLLAQSLDASLTVADVRRSVAWYRDVLRFWLTVNLNALAGCSPSACGRERFASS